MLVSGCWYSRSAQTSGSIQSYTISGSREGRTARLVVRARIRVVGPTVAIFDGWVPIGSEGAVAAKFERLARPRLEAQDVAGEGRLGGEAVEPLVFGVVINRPEGVLVRGDRRAVRVSRVVEGKGRDGTGRFGGAGRSSSEASARSTLLAS